MREGWRSGVIGAFVVVTTSVVSACTTTERVAPLPTPVTTTTETTATTATTGSTESPPMSTAVLDAPSAIMWGAGPVGVVLAHGSAFDASSWTPLAEAIATSGATVVAVDDVTDESLIAAADQLRASGATSVTLVGASAGADAVLKAAAREPDLADQYILLSANAQVDGLGDEPKLFIASADEPSAGVSQQIADAAPGDHNEVVLVPGDAHAQHLFTSAQSEAVLGLILDHLPPP